LFVTCLPRLAPQRLKLRGSPFGPFLKVEKVEQKELLKEGLAPPFLKVEKVE
jgi:hypothetical protein